MDKKRVLLRVVATGLDQEIIEWCTTQAKEKKLPWRIRTCEPIRVMAPEMQIGEQDMILVAWDQLGHVELADALSRISPAFRSIEGMMAALDEAGGEELCSKVVVLGRTVTREDAMFLAEYGVKHIIPMAERRSHLDRDAATILAKIENAVTERKAAAGTDENRAIAKFTGLLRRWEALADETKMQATEELLRYLGDSSKYSELIARKCLKEKDLSGAESWLQRAITRNPSFLRASQLLVDVYYASGRYDDALEQLQKIRANNPRSVRTLIRIGKCYTAKSEPQKAEKYLMDAVSIDEFSSEAREELGKVKFALKEYEVARKLFANTKAPHQLATHLNRIGISLVEKGKFPASVEHYRWAQFVLPGNDQAHFLFFNIALAYAKWGKKTEALGFARLAKTRQPTYAKAEALIKSLEEKRAA